MKTILFIPFTANENNFSLYIRALDWRCATRRQDDNTYEDPGVVIYTRPEESAEDYEDYSAAEFKFTQDNIEDNTVIYVLADGMGEPSTVLNTNDAYYEYLSDEPYKLFIGAVAWRMKQCGLTPELAQQLSSIKLFICDENNTNHLLASYFAQSLGEPYKTVTVNYYSAVIYIPHPVKDDEAGTKTKKLAALPVSVDSKHNLKGAGYAHEHRHSLTVEDALKQAKSPYSSTELEQSKAFRLPTYKESLAASPVCVEDVSDGTYSQQDYSMPVITSLDDDTPATNADEPVVIAGTQCTTIIVWQPSNIFAFFKPAETSSCTALIEPRASSSACI